MHRDNYVEGDGCTQQRNSIDDRLKRGRDNQDHSTYREAYGNTMAQRGPMVTETFERQS